MAVRPTVSTSFWQKLRRGPWGKAVVERIEAALDTLTRRLRTDDAVAALVVFGSYARGDFGRKSDLDLLVLLRPDLPETERIDAERRVTRVVLDVETEEHLPVQLAPLVASAGDPSALGPSFLHEVWTDGIILYGEAADLAMLRPGGLAPWIVARFSLGNARPRERVRLARRLHGQGGKPGIVRRPGLDLARGAAFVPADQSRALRDALDEAGAIYDLIPVWREA